MIAPLLRDHQALAATLGELDHERSRSMEDRYSGATPGPWMWHGSSRKTWLCTEHSGRLLILDVEHRPVAQPSLRLRTPNCVMRRLQEFARPDHNGEFFEVDHPDARLIADAWRLPALERDLAAARAALRACADTAPPQLLFKHAAAFEGALRDDAARAEGER